MEVKKESPCLTCQRVSDTGNCDNKQCRQWQSWFLSRWEQIHGYYEKYTEEAEK